VVVFWRTEWAFRSIHCGLYVLDALGIMLKVLWGVILVENKKCWLIREVKWHSGTNNVPECPVPREMLEADLIFVRLSH
jgi:hypothetical protein